MIEFKNEMEKDTEEDEAVYIFLELLSNCYRRRTSDLMKLSETQIIWIYMTMKK